MKGFREIGPEALTCAPVGLISRQWMLITAGNERNFNTMTASWGGLGELWGAPAAFCFVRPSRYTYGFMEREEYYSLSFFGEKYRAALNYCGAHSGRDVDKVKETGLTPVFSEAAPCFGEAELVLVCRKLYAEDFKPERFADPAFFERVYPKGDVHRAYIGAITKVLEAD